ncbi:MAG TPA: helix-turn-helix domain-containing protein [Pyrinomonadaceae bacterium]|nr:helix-turn-helix domain-containing protein [Pyrinomonadaceae bacterium]
MRERREDIPLLAAHLLRQHTPEGEQPPALDEGAMSYLVAYSWPGNVRELENVIERAVTLRPGGHISAEDLPPKVLSGETGGAGQPQTTDDLAGRFAGLPTLDDIERRYLLHVLEATGGNRKRAAEILGINRRTLYRMADRFRIDLEDRRPSGD